MVKKRVISNSAWFRRSLNSPEDKWGLIPINWKGYVSLSLLVAINVFAANYFDVMNSPFSKISRFLVVFFISIFIFIVIDKRRTEGIKAPRDSI